MREEICVKIYGLNLTRIVDRLVLKGILVKDLSVKSNSIKFVISYNDIGELNKICKIEKKHYQIVYKNGLKNIFFKLPYYLGTLLALFITFTYILVVNMYVYKININNNTSLSYDINKIQTYLSEQGFQQGMYRKDIDIVELQNNIIKNFNDISGCTVRLDGGNLNITIYPATLKENKNKIIVSKYDAIITKAVAYSGELKVKEGDLVKKGQVLIQSDKEALGEIEGKVYFTSSIIYNECQQYLERTGKTYTYDNILFFKKLRYNGKNKCEFTNYETEKCTFYLNANLFIPIEIERITLYEVEVKQKIVPFTQLEDEIMQKAYNEALKLITDTDLVTNVTYSVVSEGNYTRVDCFIETNMSLI